VLQFQWTEATPQVDERGALRAREEGEHEDDEPFSLNLALHRQEVVV
jgi:hypothetical protein